MEKRQQTLDLCHSLHLESDFSTLQVLQRQFIIYLLCKGTYNMLF